MNGNWDFWLMQSLSHGPPLLVCLIGFVLAIMFIDRNPGVSILTMLGTGLLIGVTIGNLLYIRCLMSEEHRNFFISGLWSTLIGISFTFARTLGMALILTAVFVGRKHSAQVPVLREAPPPGDSPPIESKP